MDNLPADLQPDTAAVTVTVLGIEAVTGMGACIALAVIEVDVAGVVFTIQGARVMRSPDGLRCLAPCFRHPRSGEWLPGVVLPPELSEHMAREVLAAVR